MTKFKAPTHCRLASKAAGDDITLTRYVRIDGARRHRVHQNRLPSLELGFVRESRTKYPTRVLTPPEMTTLLVSGHSNVKIGRDVRKGRMRGYWLYTLSLEERKTCPSSCVHWQSCYGNNMPYAKRIDHTHPDFLPRLEAELADLCRKRVGVLVRLHALGDFYDVPYVVFWRQMLMQHRNLSIFGYTGREPDSDIGWALRALAADFKERAMVRFSNADWPIMATVSIANVESRPDGAFVCPEQTEQTRCCATCGACWSTQKNVAFLAH